MNSTRDKAHEREAMRQKRHPYNHDLKTGLCATCAAGRVFWVHRPPQQAA